MTSFLVKRVLLLIPLFLGITLVSFAVLHLAPGKPTDMSTTLNPDVSLEARARLEKLYGLDQPLPVQYWHWLSRLARLDSGGPSPRTGNWF